MSRTPHVTTGAFAPPEPVRRITAISADGAPLHVELHGPEGAPAVVLAHGWVCNTAFWAAQIRDLASDHRVIAYDQRGHGRSAPTPGGYRTELLADDLEAVLNAALAPAEKAVLAGHSMGGMTIMAAAARPAVREHAAAVLLCNTGSSRLAAESTVVPIPASGLRTWLTKRILGARLPLGPVTPAARAALRFATMGRGAAKDRIEACAQIAHGCPTRTRVAWGHVLAELEVGPGLRAIEVPTAIIGGTADKLTPLVHARSFVPVLKECVGLQELAGVGHMGPIEAPEAVTAKIRELSTAYLPLKGAAA